MKINIISETGNGLSPIDSEVLNLMFKKMKDKTEFNYDNVYNYKLPNASINIFLHVINHSFISRAKINIAIIDHQYINENNVEYLGSMDYVLAKTDYSFSVLESAMKSNKNLINLGWNSPNIVSMNHHKNYDRILMYCEDKYLDTYNKVIESWKPEYPKLDIVSLRGNVEIKDLDYIEYQNQLNNETFHQLFNTCGFHLILDETPSFSHILNQCKQVGSIPIAINGGANKELMNSDFGFPIPAKKKKSTDQSIGSRFTFNTSNLDSIIAQIKATSEVSFKLMSKSALEDYTKMYSQFDVKFKDIFKDIFLKVRNTKKISLLSLTDEELPTVSIITPTYNRRSMFRLPILNFNSTDYPKHKLQWIIVEDSEYKECIELLLPPKASHTKMGLKYIRLDEKTSIGQKRNIAIENADNEVIVCMDDDDYYYPQSIRNRVNALMTYQDTKKCVACTTIGTFDINRFISMINIVPLKRPFYERVSPATLTFFKSFYTPTFTDSNRNECRDLLENRLQEVHEISWENIIVGLVHKNNISDMKAPTDQKPNGSHFGFSEKLFKFITTLT
jgi:hypothetical protein